MQSGLHVPGRLVTFICGACAAAAAASWRAASAFQCSATLFAAARCSSTCRGRHWHLQKAQLCTTSHTAVHMHEGPLYG